MKFVNEDWLKEIREKKSDYIKLHKKERKIHSAVTNAVRSGKLIKPGTCEKCGRNIRVSGHHYDYDKPLEVTWLCQKCHWEAHNMDIYRV